MTVRLQKILLPTDFSKYSAAATKYACEMAMKFDAELHLLHTLETHLASKPNFGFGLDLPKYVSESKAASEKSLAGVLDPKGRQVEMSSWRWLTDRQKPRSSPMPAKIVST